MKAATESGNDAVAVLLRDAGAPEWHESEAPATVSLVAIAARRDWQLVTVLLDAGADPNQRDPDGFTLLMIVAGLGEAAMVERLLEVGANVNLETRDGYTALSAAWDSGHEDVVAILERAAAAER